MQRKFDNTKITVEFEETENRQQLSSGDSLKMIFAKIKKWFTDLKPIAFSGSYNDLEDKPIFTGTKEEYEAANALGKIKEGTIVYITND